MPSRMLATVWHTGTQYFKYGLEWSGGVHQVHFNQNTCRNACEYDELFTTYRDPYEVAASWINRGYFSGAAPEKNRVVWDRQWSFYKDFLELDPVVFDITKGVEQKGLKFPKNPINNYPDKHEAHKRISNGDLDYIYSFIPKKHIDLAIECSRRYTNGNLQ